MSELPDSLRQQVEALGQRSRDTTRLDSAILALCTLRPFSLHELAAVTGRNPNYLRIHYIRRLLEKGWLQRKYPDEPNRPDQAYIATEEQE
jgi:ATP-dependent DNA helicase RecG